MNNWKAALLFAIWLSLPAHGSIAEKYQTAALPSRHGNPVDAYQAQIPKSVIELQQFRRSAEIAICSRTGRKGKAGLINLNPFINSWFLLSIHWADEVTPEVYHLENTQPARQRLLLDPDFPVGITIVSDNESFPCPLWDDGRDSILSRASKSSEVYASLAEGRLLLRNKTKGYKTSLEKMTDFLRLHVWKGERITAWVRKRFFHDAYRDTSEIIESPGCLVESSVVFPEAPAPMEPTIAQKYRNDYLLPQNLDFSFENCADNRLQIGKWYPVQGVSNVFASVVEPRLVESPGDKNTHPVNSGLDETEAGALVYMVAFDLEKVDLAFEIGTDHPKVNWSDQVPLTMRDTMLPGPDGIATPAPLIMTGMVRPMDRQRITATFAGGFKRYHGAFRRTALAYQNHGSHYGFIEHGTVLSKLQPGLATLVVYADGRVALKTWTSADNRELAQIRHARQNGIPIVDGIGRSQPVGSDRYFRSVRSGLAIQENAGKRFLIYAYFSDATPATMALVFRAYHCRYAMHLDMNALEHTYFALYTHSDGHVIGRPLVKGMRSLEQAGKSGVIQRFVECPDNRDFFYLLKKDQA